MPRSRAVPSISSPVRWRRRGERARRPRARARVTNEASTKVVEYMGATLTSDDFISSCAPWGAMCVTLGTKYVPIGLPSVIGSVFLLAPMVWAFKEVRARDKEIFRLRERLGTNADEDA